MLIAVLLCVSGMCVGYAFMAVTSEQEIDNNTIVDQYIILTTNSDDVLSEIAFDTVNTDSGVVYKIHTDGTTIDTNDALKISVDNWNVTVANTNVDSDTYTLNVTVTDFTPVTGLTYVMKINNTNVAYSGGWSFSGLEYDTAYSVALYVYGTCDTASSGFVNYDSTTNPETVGSVFKFVSVAEPITP